MLSPLKLNVAYVCYAPFNPLSPNIQKQILPTDL